MNHWPASIQWTDKPAGQEAVIWLADLVREIEALKATVEVQAATIADHEARITALEP